ncbi:MAG: hypothetical protein LBS99_06550 [Clostridiales bacterium]|nr:hypothetical protein [Clostridiales bacterium]
MTVSPGKQVAYAGVFSALSVVFIMLGVFFQMLELFWFYVATFCVMFPLAKDYYFGAIAVYVVTCVLGLLFSGFNLASLSPYIIFMGWHPILAHWMRRAKVPLIARKIIVAVIFDVGYYLLYLLARYIVFDSEWINRYILVFIAVAITPLALLYDFGLGNQQRQVRDFVRKLSV